LPQYTVPHVAVGESPVPIFPGQRWKDRIRGDWYLVQPDPANSAQVIRQRITIVSKVKP